MDHRGAAGAVLPGFNIKPSVDTQSVIRLILNRTHPFCASL